MINSFDNTEYAFEYKSNKDLKGAKFLFSMMAKPWIVSAGAKLAPWAVKTGLPVKRLIRNTLFRQFVGGESLEATKRVAELLGKYHVDIILDYAVEGGDDNDAEYDHAKDEFIKVIDYAATVPNIPFMSVKVTGITRFGLLEYMDAEMQKQSGPLMQRYYKVLALLSNELKLEWEKVVNRLDLIFKEAYAKNVGALIDAEESWIQNPIDAVVMEMMDKYNKEKAVVYNTAQLYRHDRLQFLKDSYTGAAQRNFVLGIKLVRGAYMEKERARAAEKGYTSPIQQDKAATDADFNAAVRFCIDHIDRISSIVSSHNEESNLKALKYLDEKGLPHHNDHIHFSQLYGMSDNITFNLAHEGCNVSKYLPFGPIEDVIPYLMRRAQENTAVKGQTGRELKLINTELKRRRLV